jgi:C4-dicarboxylate transporter DctQ subunit
MALDNTSKWVEGIHRAATVLEVTLAAALIAAVIMNVINIVARYVFGQSLTGVDEWQVYLMVAMAFAGSVVAAVRGQHLRMDVLTRYFPRAARRVVGAIEAVSAVLLCGFVCAISTHYASRMHAIGSVSENGHIPMWLPHSIVALAFAGMTLVGLADLVLRLMGSRLATPPSAVEVVAQVSPEAAS